MATCGLPVPEASGWSVVDEEMESSRSSDRVDEGGDGGSPDEDRSSIFPDFFPKMFSVMRFWEKGVLCGSGVREYSSTVDLIALVISSLDVYGKHMLRMHLRRRLACGLSALGVISGSPTGRGAW